MNLGGNLKRLVTDVNLGCNLNRLVTVISSLLWLFVLLRYADTSIPYKFSKTQHYVEGICTKLFENLCWYMSSVECRCTKLLENLAGT